MKAQTILPLALLGMIACGETEECRRLDEVHTATRRALAAAKGRAQLADRTGKSLERIQAETETKIEANGLDLDEGAIVSALEARLESVEGATFLRTTRPGEPKPGAEQHAFNETVLRFEFPAKGLEQAWAKAQVLMMSPPLTHILGLIAPKKRGDKWRLDLGRPDIQRLPMKIEPRPLPEVPSADDVPSEFGFCGASEKRAEIAQMKAETESFAEQAAATTVNLPLTASWNGLSRRTDRVLDTETQSRELVDALVNATLDSNQTFMGIAAEPEAVLLELAGDPSATKAVQSKLPESMLEALQELPPPREGVARMAIGNGVAAAARRPEQRGGGGLPPLDPNAGRDHAHGDH